MNHLVRQYYEQNSHIVLVDTGNSYQGLCELIHRKTKGEDGIYYTYTEEKPIAFNPFFTDDYKFSVEKKDSIKTLLLALWKGEDEKITKTESGEPGQCGVGVHPPDTAEPGHRPLVRHLLRVHAERLPEGTGCKGHQGEPEGLQHRQLPDHAQAVLQGRTLRLPAELEREHRPAAQAVHRI